MSKFLFYSREDSLLLGKGILCFHHNSESKDTKNLLYITHYSPEGSKGFIINKIFSSLSIGSFFRQILSQHHPECNDSKDQGKDYHDETLGSSKNPEKHMNSLENKNFLDQDPLCFGGPQETQRGFVLHTLDYCLQDTLLITSDIGLTSHMDILKDIMNQKGPEHFKVFLGRMVWGPGQLEEEILKNFWLPLDITHEDLFHSPPQEKWETLLNRYGIQEKLLAYGYGGKALQEKS